MDASVVALAPDTPYLAATPRAGGLARYQHYIDGRFADPASGDWIDSEDPVAGRAGRSSRAAVRKTRIGP
jgi:hypothetical protein